MTTNVELCIDKQPSFYVSQLFSTVVHASQTLPEYDSQLRAGLAGLHKTKLFNETINNTNEYCTESIFYAILQSIYLVSINLACFVNVPLDIQHTASTRAVQKSSAAETQEKKAPSDDRNSFSRYLTR